MKIGPSADCRQIWLRCSLKQTPETNHFESPTMDIGVYVKEVGMADVNLNIFSVKIFYIILCCLDSIQFAV